MHLNLFFKARLSYKFNKEIEKNNRYNTSKFGNRWRRESYVVISPTI